MTDMREWLKELGLDQYADEFEAGAICPELIPELDHGVLKDLGVPLPGHRLHMLKAARIGISVRPGPVGRRELEDAMPP